MININDYNYPLPDERIAKHPVSPRDHSKLLVYRDGKLNEDLFFHIGQYIPADSLLIYNNTRVIQARLVFHKQSTDGHEGARIEVFCLNPTTPSDYQLSLSSTTGCVWKCMVGNLKKWKSGPLTLPFGTQGGILSAERLSTSGNTHEIRFSWNDSTVSFAEILDQLGELPIPPYLNRPTEESDKTTYQTVYSRIKGSVAAPTAGLHFTDEVLDGLRQQGIKMAELTLHVGAGTFQPVKTEDADQHPMHTEIIAVPRQTIQDIKDNLGHIVAVGTTSMRTLESLYWMGALHTLAVSQFDPYNTLSIAPCNSPHDSAVTPSGADRVLIGCSSGADRVLNEPRSIDPDNIPVTYISTAEALQNLLNYLDETHQDTLHGETQIMIKPGYTFRVVDQLITNFHQPKSTLLLLVSAFIGNDWHSVYDYALKHDFRFLSYGDSSILFKNDKDSLNT